MEVETLKSELHDKIEYADEQQLQELYGLIINYFNGKGSEEQWDLLSEDQITLINKSIEQADAGMGIPVKEALLHIRDKYGLND